MSEDPKQPMTPGDPDMHPAAKLMFGWVSNPNIGKRIFWGLFGLSLLLIFADVVFDRHPHNEAESYIGFYGIYGFCAFAFVVLMGWPLGRLLRRGENYYGDADDGEGGQ